MTRVERHSARVPDSHPHPGAEMQPDAWGNRGLGGRPGGEMVDLAEEGEGVPVVGAAGDQAVLDRHHHDTPDVDRAAVARRAHPVLDGYRTGRFVSGDAL